MNIEKQLTNSTSIVDERLKPISLGAYAHKRLLFVIAVLFQLGLLAITAAPPAMTLANGKTVTLDTKPVDPWDMFRGDYVVLSYDISEVPSAQELQRDEQVYVVLRKNNKDKWDAIRLSKTKPIVSNDEVFIKGKAQYSNQFITTNSNYQTHVRYGIEQVYVPEGAGRNLKSGDNLQVDATIAETGHAVIRGVRARGNTLYRWNWF